MEKLGGYSSKYLMMCLWYKAVHDLVNNMKESVRKYTHDCLQWLETNVRKRVEGSYFDLYVALPLKKIYCDLNKQS